MVQQLPAGHNELFRAERNGLFHAGRNERLRAGRNELLPAGHNELCRQARSLRSRYCAAAVSPAAVLSPERFFFEAVMVPVAFSSTLTLNI